MRRFRKILVRAVTLIVLATAIAAAGIQLFFPHVYILLAQGYPSAVWPAKGDFATVNGAGEREGVWRLYDPLPEGLSALFAGKGGSAFLAERNGNMISEAYAQGLDASTRFNSFSLVKSLVGFLALAAVDEGRIASLDTRLDAIDPGLGHYLVGGLTLREALDMRSGVSFEARGVKSASGADENGEKAVESVPWNPFGPLGRLHAAGLAPILADIRVSEERRGTFEYQNVNTALVGHVLEAAYGKGLDALLSERIWQPSGAADAYWRRYPGTGRVTPYCCIYATAGDWMKVGRFILDNGAPGRPLLSPAMRSYWMGDDIDPSDRRKGAYRAFTRHDVLDRPGELAQGPFLYFLGQDGQVVYLHPGLDLVAVRFGHGMQLLHSTLYETVR